MRSSRARSRAAFGRSPLPLPPRKSKMPKALVRSFGGRSSTFGRAASLGWFLEIVGARRLGRPALVVRGVFRHAGHRVQERVDAEDQAAELVVLDLEPQILLAVDDGEKAVL